LRAYLEARHAGTTERLVAAVERHTDPVARLIAVFDAQGELFAEPGFRGCAFVTATAKVARAAVEQLLDGALRPTATPR
jgi:hypothetical protein